jgi:hypothetical protein
MEISTLLLLAIPTALVGLKLSALVLASVWALSGAFAPRGLMHAWRIEAARHDDSRHRALHTV